MPNDRINLDRARELNEREEPPPSLIRSGCARVLVKDLIVETGILRDRLERAANVLFDQIGLDVEHEIWGHADTMPDRLRQLHGVIRQAWDIVAEGTQDAGHRMKQPAFILENGTKVMTAKKLSLTTGMLIKKQQLDLRKAWAPGTITGVVGGHGGDVYWVQHAGDPLPAPYCFDEFDLVT